MVEKVVVVQNERGIHVRPCSIIAQAMKGFAGKAFVVPSNGRQEQITTMPISLMGLALRKGAVITIRVEGEGAEQKLQQLAELFEKEYDFS